MRAADLITTSVLILVGGVIIVDAVRLGIGWGTEGPRSGFFPFWLATILVACCAGVLVQTLRRDAGRPFVTRERLKPVLTMFGPALGFVILTTGVTVVGITLLPALGLYVASALYLAFSMRWLGQHRWSMVAVLAIGLPTITFVIFERWFLVPMPKGPLEAWLGF
jgi:putative tricarboxylic transport membrane protein